MPFPHPHNLLQVYGLIDTDLVLPAPEEWTITLRMGRADGAGAFTDSVPSGTLDAIEAALKAWWLREQPRMARTVKFSGFKFNAVGTDGRYLSAVSTWRREWAPDTATSGSVSQASCPPQCTVAVTLETGAMRGLAHRGRVFLPPPAVTVLEGGGQLSAAAQGEYATSFAQLLQDLNNVAAPEPGEVIVASKVREGAIRRVTGVKVGRVVDTQRRRRRSLEEGYSVVTPVSA